MGSLGQQKDGLTQLYVDDALVAIDKPPGLLVHPSKLDAHESRNALEWLQALRGEPLWPLHRLDKATSGVLVFARSVQAARLWGAAFERGQVGKQYLAVVRGWPEAQGVIDEPLARDPERPSAGQPRVPATTRYWRLACLEWPFNAGGRHPSTRTALVEVQPLSGRRQQIRRHFKHIAHPLIGDSTHGKGLLNRAAAEWLGVRRLWLHAWRISLGELQIEAPPGPEWAHVGWPGDAQPKTRQLGV